MIESILFKNTAPESSADFIPKHFTDYIGQEELKKRLFLHIKAAQGRNEPLDHILLFGPPGLGKTTLAHIIAQEMGSFLKITTGPSLQRTGDMVAILSSLKKGSILFIDEIHRMAKGVEETLYTAMESFRIDIIIGQGSGAKTVSLPVQPFTLIGATTRAALISHPLQTRFGIIEKFDLYEDHELAQIVKQSASFFHMELDDQSAHEIASRSRGTPRIAKKLTRKIRDYLQIHSDTKSTLELVQDALIFFGVAPQGLTRVDEAILRILKDQPAQKAVSLNTLAALIGEDPETIENVYEPYLLHQGYIERTPRGRVLGNKLIDKKSEQAEIR